MSGAVVIGISFDGMDAAKKKIRKALDAANAALDDLSKAAGSLQVYDGRLVQKAGALDSMRNRINGRITGLQQMNAHVDYAVRRFKETDELCAQRMRVENFEIKKTLGLPRGGGIFGGIVDGLVSIVIMAEAAWNWVNKDNKKTPYGPQAGFNKRGFIPGSGEAALIAGGIPTTGKFVYEGMKAVKGVSEGAKVAVNLPPWGYNGAPPAGWTGSLTSNGQSSTPSTEGTDKDNQTSYSGPSDPKYNKKASNGEFGTMYYMDIPDPKNAQPWQKALIKVDPEWVKDNIVQMKLPENLQSLPQFNNIKSLQVNKSVLKNWEQVFDTISNDPEMLKLIKQLDPGTFWGRHTRNNVNNGISNHSWGTAIDINVPAYGLGTYVDPVKQPNDPNLILFKKVFEPAGFSWGNSYKDPMHFEILKKN